MTTLEKILSATENMIFGTGITREASEAQEEIKRIGRKNFPSPSERTANQAYLRELNAIEITNPYVQTGLSVLTVISAINYSETNDSDYILTAVALIALKAVADCAWGRVIKRTRKHFYT